MDHNELLSKVTSWHLTSSNVTLRIQMTKLPLKKKKTHDLVLSILTYFIVLGIREAFVKNHKEQQQKPIFYIH